MLANSNMQEFEAFTEISIGGVTREQLIQRLMDAGIQFNEYAHILFKHSSFTPDNHIFNVKLVKVTLTDLGLNNPCSFQDIIDKGLSLGLQLCPLYLAAFLRLEYLDQADGPYLTIASPRPEIDEAYPTGFYIRNLQGSLWLRGYRVEGEAEWPLDNEFVFMKHGK
jgi:hypothetical protein